MIKQYKSPQAFRTALAERQKQRAAKAGVPSSRLAQVDLYFRFLARVLQELGEESVVVKGGVALEMRLQRARTTLDVDVRALGVPDDVYERIHKAGLLDLGDFLTFKVEEPSGAHEIEGEGVIYEGRRFRVQAVLANRPYLSRFGLDVAFGDPMVGAPDKIVGPDALSFIGITPPEIPVYPLATHLAEKLHAYTMPRPAGRPNSRLKDLLDIALVAIEEDLLPSQIVIDASELSKALRLTFESRKSHPVPTVLPAPPPEWSARYPEAQASNDLPWESLEAVLAEATRFLDPVLAGTALGVWNPRLRSWLK